MQVITHLHTASTQLQSIVLSTFLDAHHPALVIVSHSSLDFLLLPNVEATTLEPLAKIAHAEINARILAASPFTTNGRQHLAVLTDHHRPRLLILEADRVPSATSEVLFTIKCSSTILFDEMARLPAELGLGTWTVSSGDRQAVVAHTHSGVLRVLPTGGIDSEASLPYASRVFSVPLPHPTLLSLAPIDASPRSDLTVALLSISSTPSTLPGLGSQCLPVLSFHTIDEAKHELVPLPWGGPDRKVLPLIEEFKAGARKPDDSGGGGAQSSKNNGPQAKGKTLTPEEVRAREQKLAKSALGRSHVQLPFSDALGAHLITALPRSAGGGVIVWSETSILLVPCPVTEGLEEDTEEHQAAEGETPPARGKRRKASVTSPLEGRASQSTPMSGPKPSTSGDSFAVSTSPETAAQNHFPPSQANVYGKRRRSSAKKGSLNPEDAAPLDSSPSTTKASNSQSKMLRLVLPRPLQVTSAEIVTEGGAAIVPNQGTERATLNVLFSTMAGALNLLEIALSRVDGCRWRPRSMKASRIGTTSRTSGPGSLTYLGEGYVHAASASGDSCIAQMVSKSGSDACEAGDEGTEDTEMVSPPVSPIKSSARRKSSVGGVPGISSALAHSQSMSHSTAAAELPASARVALSSIRTFPSLAPLLDFVIDGNANAISGGAQARIVAACGSGPDGAIAIVKNGVSVEELGSLAVNDAQKLWSIHFEGQVGIVCGFAEHTRILRLGAEGVTDVSESMGLDLSARTIESGSLRSDSWVHVTEKSVTIRGPDGVHLQWHPSLQQTSSTAGQTALITSASLDPASSQVLIALKGGHIVLLSVEEHALETKATAALPEEVSALHLNHGIAAVGQWKSNTVCLFALPHLENVTPIAMQDEEGSLGSLPRSLLIHTFSEPDSEPSRMAQLFLLVGLTSGSVVAYSLALPTADSLSRTIGVFDKKTSSLGNHPVRLRSFTTAPGKTAVLALNGETSTVIWAERHRLTFSALSYSSIASATPISLPGAEPTLALALPDRIQFSSIREIGKLQISKAHLGIDNPTAVAGVYADERGHHRYFAAVTTPFRPEGSSTKEHRMSKVVLMDGFHCSKIAEIDLEPNERAGCIGVMHSGNDEYLIVGTGFVNPYESEVFEGRLLGFAIDATDPSDQASTAVEMTQVFEKQVHGNVYAVATINRSRLVAAINSEVISFSLENNRSADSMDVDDQLYLRQRSRWGCAFIACTLSPIVDEPMRFVVGDGLRSLCVLRVDAVTGELKEIARDCDPFWTTACSSLDSASQTFIGSDINFNLFTAQRANLSPETKRRIQREEERRKERAERGDESAAKISSNQPPVLSVDDEVAGEWSHIMERRGAWHYGDLINRFREGTLVTRPSEAALGGGSDGASTTAITAPPVEPRLVFCTSSGALGIVSTLSEEAGRVLSQVERNLHEYLTSQQDRQGTTAWSLAPLGDIPASEYRTLRTDHRTAEPVGFIDGDLILRAFVHTQALDQGQKMDLLQDLAGGGIGKVEAGRERVEELVEALARVC